MRRLLLCLLVAGVGIARFRARRRGVPAVPVQLRDQQVQPVPLRARGRRPDLVVGPQRGGRHDQHGGRRRLPARRGQAAVVVRGRAPTCAWRRRAPPTAATSRRNSRGSRCRRISTRASRSARRSRCTSKAACAARRGPSTIRSAGSLRRHRRSLHLARALPDVAAERDRPLRAHRALLRALRPPRSSSTSSSSGVTPGPSSTTRRTRRRAATSRTSGSFTCPRSRRRRRAFPTPCSPSARGNRAAPRTSSTA